VSAPRRGDNPFPADENTDLLPRVVRARRRLGVVWFVLGVATLGAAGATFVVAGSPEVAPATTAALGLEAKAIASAVDASARAAHVRSDRIATHKMVRAAIMTDAATAADMANSDFNTTPIKDERLIPGETLEMFQIQDGKATSLVRIPADAHPLAVPDGRDTRLVDDGKGGLLIVVGAPIEPYKQGEPGYREGITGSLAMAIPIDLTFIRQQAAAHAVKAELLGADKPIALVSAADPVGPELTLPVQPSPEWRLPQLQLSAIPVTTATEPGWLVPARYGGFAVGVALLALALLALRRR